MHCDFGIPPTERGKSWENPIYVGGFSAASQKTGKKGQFRSETGIRSPDRFSYLIGTLSKRENIGPK